LWKAILIGTVRSRLRFSTPTPALIEHREKRNAVKAESLPEVGTPPRITLRTQS